ncbi:MAG: DUF2946 domain-containing protein [Comamonadaceae bacterium]|nr:MAG: DUF2946 domain-containing protein [Comamonadaceae bacterium]
MLHALRSARSLARLALAWFVVSVGVAVAAPALHPAQALERICSGSGEMRWVPAALAGPAAADVGAAPASGHHTLDCPLCLSPAPPPRAVAPTTHRAPALAHHTVLRPASPPVALTRSPFPPRAPPGGA